MYCIVLYCIVLFCIVLYCIVLYCIVLYTVYFLRFSKDGQLKVVGAQPELASKDASTISPLPARPSDGVVGVSLKRQTSDSTAQVTISATPYGMMSFKQARAACAYWQNSAGDKCLNDFFNPVSPRQLIRV